MTLSRRDYLHLVGMGAGGLAAGALPQLARSQDVPLSGSKSRRDLTIKDMKVTPIALPDPPLLAASGCHGPYFLRNVVEVETDAGIVGVGETKGGAATTRALEQARPLLRGRNAFAYRAFARELVALSPGAYA